MKFYLGGPLCVTEVECENKVDTNAHDCVQPQELVYITTVLQFPYLVNNTFLSIS